MGSLSIDNTMTLRHGVNNTVKNNTFINIQLGKYGEDHQLIGNRLVNSDILIGSGSCLQADVPTGGGCYPVAANWLVAANIVENGKIIVGTNTGRPHPGQDTTLAGNQAQIEMRHEIRTTILPTYEGDAGAPVLLKSSQVGPGAYPGDEAGPPPSAPTGLAIIP